MALRDFATKRVPAPQEDYDLVDAAKANAEDVWAQEFCESIEAKLPLGPLSSKQKEVLTKIAEREYDRDDWMEGWEPFPWES